MVKLLDFTIKDAPELISRIKNEKMLLQFAGPMYHFPLTEGQLQKDMDTGNRTLFKIADEAGTIIGHAQICMKDETFLLGRILIWDENNRGKGYGKKVMLELLRFGFNHSGKETAELNVYDWNTAAIECYKKVGFTIDPEIRNEAKMDNEIWISLNMKIHKSTFEQQML